MGMFVAMQGRVDEANDLVARSRAIMNDVGQWIWIVPFWYAFVSVWQGDPAAAERELLLGYEALKKMGEKSHFSSIAHELSSVLYLQGRYDEAEQLTRECEEAHACERHPLRHPLALHPSQDSGPARRVRGGRAAWNRGPGHRLHERFSSGARRRPNGSR